MNIDLLNITEKYIVIDYFDMLVARNIFFASSERIFSTALQKRHGSSKSRRQTLHVCIRWTCVFGRRRRKCVYSADADENVCIRQTQTTNNIF